MPPRQLLRGLQDQLRRPHLPGGREFTAQIQQGLTQAILVSDQPVVVVIFT